MMSVQDNLIMRYYPVFLNIVDKPCLVVGGGSVGTRKVESLLRCGASVTVVSPEVSDTLRELSECGKIVLRQRQYRPSDLDDALLVFGATDNPKLNRRLHREAEAHQRWCNIADHPDLCSFLVPSVVNQGALTVAVSTGGKSPALAKHLRRGLKAMFGPEYDQFLVLMGAIRARLLSDEHAPEDHKAIFEQLIDSDLLDMLRKDDRHGIDALLNRILGPDYSFDELMQST